jgi:hypothetical protein
MPVTCVMDAWGRSLIYDEPAPARQINATVKMMVQLAGIRANITSHDVRRGATLRCMVERLPARALWQADQRCPDHPRLLER